LYKKRQIINIRLIFTVIKKQYLTEATKLVASDRYNLFLSINDDNKRLIGFFIEKPTGYMKRRIHIIDPSFVYMLKKALWITVLKQNNTYIAKFSEAYLYASGETIDNALINLKDIIIGTFEVLDSHSIEELGPNPREQYEVLKLYIKKVGD